MTQVVRQQIRILSCRGAPHQLVGLVDGEHGAVDALWHVDVGLGQHGDELLALILHAREGDGDLVIVQLLRQDGQQARLHHDRDHLTLLMGRGEGGRIESSGVHGCFGAVYRSLDDWVINLQRLGTSSKESYIYTII